MAAAAPLAARTVGLYRRRIVQAMATVVCERGYAHASVAAVCARADVTRRTFYRVFNSREEAFLAVLDEGRDRAGVLVAQAFEDAADWLEGLRHALGELLLFFEAEPEIARVCMVESLTAGSWAFERREQHVASLTGLVLSHWQKVAPSEEPYAYAGMSTMAAVIAIVQHEPLTDRRVPLICLLAPLIRVIVSSYLDEQAVAEQVAGAEELTATLLAGRSDIQVAKDEQATDPKTSESAQLPALLLDRRAHRARQALLHVAINPGSSNRQIARALGIAHDPQASALLARLAQAGLLIKEHRQAGAPNVWRLTPQGEAAAHILRHQNGRTFA